MNKTIVARWQDWSGGGIQHLVLKTRPDRIVAQGVVLGTSQGSDFAATYRVECDAMWQARLIEARVIGVDRCVDLTGDGAGHWRDGSGASMPDLDGAIDV